MTPKNRIKTLPEIIKALKPLRKKGRKIVFTNGCFDILHKGHIRLLEKAKSLGDVLIVALNTDASVKKIKGPKRPITRQGDRAFIAAALRSVDFVTFFSENTPEKIIKKISPDVLVKGGDWGKNGIAGADYIRSLGGKVYSVDFVEGYSTSGIVKKIIRQSQ